MYDLNKMMMAILGQNIMGAAGPKLKMGDIILAACYKRSYITKNQVLLMFPGRTYASVSANINRLVSSALLKSCFKAAVGEKSVYTLTGNGIEYISGLISSLYPYDEELLSELESSYHNDGIASYNHKIYANDLYFYYCSRQDLPMYAFHKEQAIDATGTQADIYNAQTGSIQRKGMLIPDAYIEYTVDYPYNDLVYTQNIYMEQDMRTQRGNVIMDKIKNYNALLSDKDNINTSEILFMIHTDSDSSVETIKPLFEPHTSPARFIRFIITFLNIFEHIKSPSISDVYSCILQHHKDILSVMSESSLNDIESRLRSYTTDELQKELPAAVLLKAQQDTEAGTYNKQYITRRNQIIRSVKNCNISNLIYSGLNIVFCCNEDISDNYDYIHVYGNTRLLVMLRAFYKEPGLEYCVSYRIHGISYPCSLAVSELNSDKEAVARGDYNNIVIENISDSVGGPMRAKKYLFDDGISNKRLILLSSTRKDAYKFIKDTFDRNTAMINDVKRRIGFVFYAEQELSPFSVFMVDISRQQPEIAEYTFKEVYKE